MVVICELFVALADACPHLNQHAPSHTHTHTQLKVLQYQGMFDLKDGPVSNQAWLRSLR